MDVDRSNFWLRLPSIIRAISNSKYISLDLEMSGIATRNTEERVNPSLKQVYENAREAAEAFTILQIGITCIVWDEKGDSYVTKTYNIPLALGIVGGDAISDQLASKAEREIAFSSKTTAFLQANGFSFSSVFDKGVPYLSAAEATHSDIINFVEKRSVVESHINIRDCPKETQEFYRDMKNKIQTWLNTQMFEEKPSTRLTLENPYEGRYHRFQKRLIHQLVETEFHGHRAQNKNGGLQMEVIKRSASPERADARTRDQRRRAVVRQTGFRYVWNAICGSRFAANIDYELIVGEHPENMLRLREEMVACEARLRQSRPVIVGHNMLWDLCFMLKTFVSPLPKTIDEFKCLMRENMPRVVDTKYLFTRGGHEMMPDQSLEECFASVKGDHSLAVKAEPGYGYSKPAAHQAGYDSYMTAVVFLKKSHRLFKDKHGLGFVRNEDPDERILNSKGLNSSTSSRLSSSPASSFSVSRTTNMPERFAHGGPRISAIPSKLIHKRAVSTSHCLLDDFDDNDDDDDDDNNNNNNNNNNKNDNNHSQNTLNPLDSKFQPLIPEKSGLPTSVSAPVMVKEQKKDPDESKGENAQEQKQDGLGQGKVPEWDEGVFWKKYGNKVRIGHSGLILYLGPAKNVG